MAKTRLGNATYVERGYGQVEPNHLSASRTGQIYAQLPADGSIDFLENGQFVKYDYKAGKVNYVGAGEWMLVYNAEKLYGANYNEEACDFVFKKSDYSASYINAALEEMPENTTMVPRVFKTNVGDIFTTNTIMETELALGDELSVNAEGYLSKTGDGAMTWQVVKVYTMPDGQKGVKIMRIA